MLINGVKEEQPNNPIDHPRTIGLANYRPSILAYGASGILGVTAITIVLLLRKRKTPR
jgi:hypothetical protein